MSKLDEMRSGRWNFWDIAVAGKNGYHQSAALPPKRREVVASGLQPGRWNFWSETKEGETTPNDPHCAVHVAPKGQ
jgi:hypothetical protein